MGCGRAAVPTALAVHLLHDCDCQEGLLRSARLKLLCAAPATLPPLVQLVLVLVALSDPISRCVMRCVGVGRSYSPYAYAYLDDAKLRSAGSQEGLPWRKSHQETVTNGRSSGTWFCRHSLL